MSVKAPPFPHTCEILGTSRDKYGDYQETTKATSVCRLRYITDVRRGTNGEERQSDAQLWLPADTDIEAGDIVRCDGTVFQCERVNKARDLDTTTIHFLKCDLEIINIGIS
jgi:hypothetical protein